MGIPTQLIGAAIAWLAGGWVAAQTLLVALSMLRRRGRAKQHYRQRQAEFDGRVVAAARAARAAMAVPDWEGWRPFRVSAIVDEARNVKSYYFTPVDGRPLAPFAPGQYVTFGLPLAGAESPLARCYSLSDRPRQDYYRCTIKRVGPPSGRGSSYFHERVRVGDVLKLRAPAGTFIVDPRDDSPIALIGAGIGITPLVSMMEAVAGTGRPREVYALFGLRNGAEHPFQASLSKLAAEHPHFRLHVSYSAPRADDMLYRDYNHVGRMTIERVRAILPSNNFRFYVCGPGAMMESLVPALWAWGVPESHVHYEAFGPASIRRVAAGSPTRSAAGTCSVRFERSERSATWDGAVGSLLELGEAIGVALPSGCRAGSCGECLVAVRRGAVALLKRPGIRVPEGHCLTCVSLPAGDLVLDA
jgi:ferredoxin-NADP reductase